MSNMEQNQQLYVLGRRVLEMVAQAVIGKEAVILRTFLAILARGHILLEDIPGVGKTTLALAFSKALCLDYSRMQFNPDVMPSDVTGFSVFDKQTGKMTYTPGAILCNLFLADELNRATSRTQSALLEAMEEGQVTVDGISHPLPQPFIVIATQNPVGAAGTQLLPDSQMDRFMIRLSLGYLNHDSEVVLLKRKQQANLLDLVAPVLDHRGLEQMCNEVDQVHVHPDLYEYIVSLVGATRKHPDILLGASPRASLALVSLSKALAYLHGRDYITPSDITSLFIDAVAHRIILRAGTGKERNAAEAILSDIVRAVRAPQMTRR